MKKVLVLIDGVGDLDNDKLKGKTPLEAADMPNLNAISKKSKLGFMYTISEDYAPESDTAVVSILGNNANVSSRGEFEALGEDVKVKRGDLVLRANFGTVENLDSRKIIDRRAGRTLTTEEAIKLADSINKNVKLPVEFKFIPTVQHRGILVLYGGFSDNITNTDTYLHEAGKIYVKEKFDWSLPLDEDENTEFSANLVNSFLNQAYKVLKEHEVNKQRIKKGLLPANIILVRDAGVEMPEINKFRNSMAIVNMPLEKGIAKLSGMKVFTKKYPEMKNWDVYENLTFALKDFADFAAKTLKKEAEDYNFCYIHFKETDVPGHDNKPIEKKNFLEILDRHFFKFLREYAEKNKVKIIVTGDHATPCRAKTHTSESLPVLVYDPNYSISADGLEFTEGNSIRGSLGKIYGRNLLKEAGFL
jgi:2,3-bisphosphoglycerate-independent phosphoglycerate mutase